MLTLRRLRSERGLSQKEVAAYINVKPRHLSNWESVQTLPSLTDAVMLARLYQVPLTTIAKACGIPTEGIN